MARKTLPGMQYFRQRELWSRSEQCVHMIGHDYKFIKRVTFPIEKFQGTGNGFGAIRSFQFARTVSGIEPLVHLRGELSMISVSNSFWRQLNICNFMRPQPIRAKFFELTQFYLRQRIGQSPCSEIGDARLPPMGQLNAIDFLPLIWIEGLEFSLHKITGPVLTL